MRPSSMAAWVTVAPMVTASLSSLTAASSGMRVISTKRPGCAKRRLSMGPSVWPPARTLAPGVPLSAPSASATVAGRT